MHNSEKLYLKWNDYENNIMSTFREFRSDQDFTDVTLACEDGQQVEAHKVILASSSPFLMDILKRNKHSRPLVCMTGTKSTDLVAILDLIYFGEANVVQENLETFFNLAGRLKLNGVSGLAKYKRTEIEKLDVKHEDKKVAIKVTDMAKQFQFQSNDIGKLPLKPEDHTKPVEVKSIKVVKHFQETPTSSEASLYPCPSCGKSFPQTLRLKKHIREVHNKERSYQCNKCEKKFFKSYRLIRHKIALHGIYPESRATSINNKIKATLDDVDGQVQSLMIMSKGIINSSKGSTVKARICMLCGKEGQWNAIRDHIETNHIAGVIHPCKLCGKTFNSRNSLYIHVRRIHK